VFQLEGTEMRELMRALAPASIDDIAALVALYRPGPMAANMHYDYADRKNGRKAVAYLHPDAEAILSDTFGLMIYQEKLMRVAQQFAGYSLAEADNLRRACGKKSREVMAKERSKFIESCVANGYTEELGERWFAIIEPFADYAFCKAHAYGYGFVAYQTAYLKANYPTEYFAALLTSVKENLDKAGIYLAECRRLGITVLVPDVNRSGVEFIPVTGEHKERSIIFGLSAVRGIGVGPAQSIVTEREENGPFRSFYDFCERVPLPVLNKGTLDSLIRAGAFDSLGHTRKGLLNVHEAVVAQIVPRRRERDQGVLSLFGGTNGTSTSVDPPVEIPDCEFDKKELLANEKAMLGLYVSDHPLNGIEAALSRKVEAKLSQLGDLQDGAMKAFGGIITGLQVKWTKRGEQMATFRLEDTEGSAEVTAFPKALQAAGTAIAEDNVVVIKARVERRDERTKLLMMEAESFVPTEARDMAIYLALPTGVPGQGVLSGLQEILKSHHGTVPVHVCLNGKTFRLTAEFWVDSVGSVAGPIRAYIPGVEILTEPPPAHQGPSSLAS
jgi:DNA polymerase-3 subunit alpha